MRPFHWEKSSATMSDLSPPQSSFSALTFIIPRPPSRWEKSSAIASDLVGPRAVPEQFQGRGSGRSGGRTRYVLESVSHTALLGRSTAPSPYQLLLYTVTSSTLDFCIQQWGTHGQFNRNPKPKKNPQPNSNSNNNNNNKSMITSFVQNYDVCCKELPNDLCNNENEL